MILPIILIFLPVRSAFLWTLFGLGCNNCCQCARQQQNSYAVPPMQVNHQNYLLNLQPPPPPPLPPMMMIPLPAAAHQSSHKTTQFYQGPPAAYPTSREELDHVAYSTDDQVLRKVIESDSVTPSPHQLHQQETIKAKNKMLSQLEQELAAEKYRYLAEKQQKQQKKVHNNNRKERIRVFRIHNNRHNNKGKNRINWHRTQLLKYSMEKGVESFSRQSTRKEGNNIEEGFIPIEVGTQPELSDHEPAGPPPNVRNKIFHDENDVIFRRRYST